MQNLEPILIFITVAEMASFTRAADSLGIQKGRASTAVRKLEEDVGVRLLHRTTRSVQLTEDGRVFHARARDLLADVDDLHSMFAGDRVALRGRLRVDLPTEVARTTIVPALPDFMATPPELELELSSTDRQVDLVQEGFDCVLRLGPIRDETVFRREGEHSKVVHRHADPLMSVKQYGNSELRLVMPASGTQLRVTGRARDVRREFKADVPLVSHPGQRSQPFLAPEGSPRHFRPLRLLRERKVTS
jgi:DNA-binding transcriptional LysR family regulator